MLIRERSIESIGFRAAKVVIEYGKAGQACSMASSSGNTDQQIVLEVLNLFGLEYSC